MNSNAHNEFYIDACRVRGLKAIVDTDFPDGMSSDDFDLWRYGHTIRKDIVISHHYGRGIPIQRQQMDLEWLGPYAAMHHTDNLTNLVLALNKQLPDFSFVKWDMYDNDAMGALIDMKPTGWALWVWDIREEVSPGRFTTYARRNTGIHFQNEADAIAFVGIMSV